MVGIWVLRLLVSRHIAEEVKTRPCHTDGVALPQRSYLNTNEYGCVHAIGRLEWLFVEVQVQVARRTERRRRVPGQSCKQHHVGAHA